MIKISYLWCESVFVRLEFAILMILITQKGVGQ